MKRALPLLLALAACQGGNGPFLRITVNDIPAGATRLRVTSIVGGRSSDPIDLSLDGKPGTTQSFALSLPPLPGLWGQLGVAALDGAEPPCTLAWQTSVADMRLFGDGTTTEFSYDLIPVSAEGCTIPRTPGMVFVPAGDYLIGCDAGGTCGPGESPQKKTRLAAFEIDLYEVTAGDYFDCANTGTCNTPVSTATYPSDSARNFVTWPLAKAFCQARGKDLPTEAQWEAAARGPAGRTYPWGEAAPSCALASYAGGPGNTTCRSIAAADVLNALLVGQIPAGASAVGALDLAGNADEWVEDAYSPRSDLGDYATPNETGSERVLKGGSLLSPASALRGAARRSMPPIPTSADPSVPPETYTVNVGFRCARTGVTP